MNTALSDLIRTAAARHGWSGREIARRARESGHSLNHDTVARYLRGDHGQPDEATLRAFAQTLDIPLTQLRRAADLPADETEPYRPPAEAARLTRRQRKAVDELIRSMVDPAAARPLRRAARRGSVEQTGD